jgi:hypothetical protein
METYGRSGGIASTFLTSALDGGEWSGSLPGRFIPREIARGTYWIGGWVWSEPAWTLPRREKSLALPGIKPRSSSPKPVAIPTELEENENVE